MVALADEREPLRRAILEVLQAERGGLFMTAPVTAEIDYLLGQRFAPPARRAFLQDLAARRYEAQKLSTRRILTSTSDSAERFDRCRAGRLPCHRPNDDRAGGGAAFKVTVTESHVTNHLASHANLT